MSKTLKRDIRKAILKAIKDDSITKDELQEAIDMVRDFAKGANLYPMGAAPGEKHVIGYMCYTDFKYELGAAYDGNRVFPSIEALKDHMKCWESCGIVEVVVAGTKIEALPNDDAQITVTLVPVEDGDAQ